MFLTLDFCLFRIHVVCAIIKSVTSTFSAPLNQWLSQHFKAINGNTENTTKKLFVPSDFRFENRMRSDMFFVIWCVKLRHELISYECFRSPHRLECWCFFSVMAPWSKHRIPNIQTEEYANDSSELLRVIAVLIEIKKNQQSKRYSKRCYVILAAWLVALMKEGKKMLIHTDF